MIIPALEGRTTMDQLEKQNPKAPNIKFKIMRAILDHLWSHVVEGTAECVTGTRGAVVFC